MTHKVLATTALALAVGFTGHRAGGALSDAGPVAHPSPAARQAAAGASTSPVLAAVPLPPMPRSSPENEPIPRAPSSDSMLAQAATDRQPVQTDATAAGEMPLDVETLKTRLRETDAIGLFTKIALKNQVDDLLEQFRTHHSNGRADGVAALREPYELLVLKVLALIQDGDPSLARTVAASREAIWGILADREKFNSAI